MVTLIEIVERDHEFIFQSGINITYNRSYEWVSIEDEDGQDVFLQGEEASQFLEQCDKLWNDLGYITYDQALSHFSRPYVENLMG